MAALDQITADMHRRLVTHLAGIAPPRHGSLEEAIATALKPGLAEIVISKGMNAEDLGGAYLRAIARTVAHTVCQSLTAFHRGVLAAASPATRRRVAQQLAEETLAERRKEVLRAAKHVSQVQNKVRSQLAKILGLTT